MRSWIEAGLAKEPPRREDLLVLANGLDAVASRLPAEVLAELRLISKGPSLSEIARALREACSDETIRSAAEWLAAGESGCGCSGEAPPEPTPSQWEEAADRLAREALAPIALNPALRGRLMQL